MLSVNRRGPFPHSDSDNHKGGTLEALATINAELVMGPRRSTRLIRKKSTPIQIHLRTDTEWKRHQSVLIRESLQSSINDSVTLYYLESGSTAKADIASFYGWRGVDKPYVAISNLTVPGSLRTQRGHLKPPLLGLRGQLAKISGNYRLMS